MRISRAFVVSISIICLLNACATGPKLPNERFQKLETEHKRISVPEVDSVATVEIGTSMISSYDGKIVESIIVNEPYKVSGVNYNGFNFIVDLQPGNFRIEGFGADGTYYSCGSLDFFVVFAGASTPVQGGIYVPNSDPVKTDFWWYSGYGGPAYRSPAPGIKFSKGTKTEIAREFLRRELVYAGISGSSVQVTYKEFVNDIARPAFTQELKYDLSQSKVIGFQGARFEVISASNTDITFKVISHMRN